MSRIPPDGAAPDPAGATTPPVPRAARRRTALDVARWLFLVAALGFGWWGLRSHRAGIADALAHTSPARVVLALAAVLAGLAMTGAVWRGILAGYGHPAPRRPAESVFFVGQLGKYIPGSVWALGAQADMARRFGVPPRTTVAVGLVFLWFHAATAVVVAAALAGQREWTAQASPWVRAAVAVVAMAAMAPAVVERVGRLLAGAPARLRLGWPAWGRIVALMALAWALYGAAAMLALPPVPGATGDDRAALLLAATGAFALAYAVGVAVILAPAGVGAREVVLVGLLEPVVGLAAAAAGALLIRAVHTVADFTIAAVAWSAARNWNGSVTADGDNSAHA
jgi:hypothetical protein